MFVTVRQIVNEQVSCFSPSLTYMRGTPWANLLIFTSYSSITLSDVRDVTPGAGSISFNVAKNTDRSSALTSHFILDLPSLFRLHTGLLWTVWAGVRSALLKMLGRTVWGLCTGWSERIRTVRSGVRPSRKTECNGNAKKKIMWIRILCFWLDL